MLSFDGGRSISVGDLAARMQTAAREQAIEGISLLGGEPLAQAAGATALAQSVRGFGLSVMVFSGFTREEIETGPDAQGRALLAWTDILVDGRYLREQPETERRWIGSANQRVHFLTDRYRADDPCWRQPNTLELRLTDGALTVNGFPARSAAGLWRRPGRRA
jgi:anaerobic ribonucleoside-triphosphate reductase activating protein